MLDDLFIIFAGTIGLILALGFIGGLGTLFHSMIRSFIEREYWGAFGDFLVLVFIICAVGMGSIMVIKAYQKHESEIHKNLEKNCHGSQSIISPLPQN